MTEKSKLQLCPGSVASYDILQEKECIYSGSQNTCKYLLTYLLSPESTVHDALKLGPVSRINTNNSPLFINGVTLHTELSYSWPRH